jgi:hypothetical protein
MFSFVAWVTVAFATGQMSLVRVQCVAVQEKIQPFFKRMFEFTRDV